MKTLTGKVMMMPTWPKTPKLSLMMKKKFLKMT
jgi:hypothetical protein